MVHYIKSMIDELTTRLGGLQAEGLDSRFQTLCEELNRLDPRDFQPAHRFEFVNLRRAMRKFAELKSGEWDYIRLCQTSRVTNGVPMYKILQIVEQYDFFNNQLKADLSTHVHVAIAISSDIMSLLSNLARILESYLGSEARSKVRDFSFMKNTDLRQIVERDYGDLILKLFPTQAWKSVVILAGSILEALLHDLLTRDQVRITDAMASNRAPQRPRSAAVQGVRDLLSIASEDQWMLNNYIEVADHLTLLPAGWKPSVQAVLRDFRNYVHPREELQMADKITEGEAFQSLGLLMKICDHIQAKYP